MAAGIAEEPGESAAAKANQCIGCHEIPGYKAAFPEIYPIPKIIGQNPAYIETALKAYRAGTRQHETMNAIAAQLSDEDIATLAKHYSEKND